MSEEFFVFEKDYTDDGTNNIEKSIEISAKKVEKLMFFLSDKIINDSKELVNTFKEHTNSFFEINEDCTINGKKSKCSAMNTSNVRRIPYATITNFLFQKYDDPRCFDLLKNNLERIIDVNNQNPIDSLTKSEKQLAYKIFDHVNLCENQVLFISNKSNDLLKSINDMESKINMAKLTYTELNKEINTMESKIFTQVLTIMTIFTGLAFVLFGGISSVSGIKNLSVDTPSHFWLNIAYLLIVGFILIWITYLLLNSCVIIINNNKYVPENSQKEKNRSNCTILKKPIFISIILLVLFSISIFLSIYTAK